jgi:hypothetical protein
LLPGKLLAGSPIGWLEYGWVVVYAPGTSVTATGDNTGTAQGTIVDLIHFDNSYGGTPTPPGSPPGSDDQMFFYSMEGSGNKANANYPGNSALSSTALTAILKAANTVSLVEPTDGLIAYNPANYFVNGESAPGFNMSAQAGGTAATQFTYTFKSVVPEPTTMIAGALLLLPFGASTLRILRKTRTA